MNQPMTNTVPETTRAEKRRAWSEFKRNARYEASNFLDFVEYKGVRIRKSKYMPHIGNKQRGIINV